MPFIPNDAQWYVADLVEEIRVAGNARLVVHINTVLINAHSPMEAYRRAMKLGRSHNSSYKNPDNKRVTFKFLGLGQLMVIHDPLEDGAELFFEERVTRNPLAIRQLVRERGKLAVFDETPQKPKPDYMPRSILHAMIKDGVVNPRKRKKTQTSAVVRRE